jgi:WD40 repeat protein
LLANVSQKSPRVTLWDLDKRECINKYRGHKQENNIIKPAFGGVNENIILCGSEDSCIYVWNRDKGDLLAKIEGHTLMVSAVHWSPSDPYVFASASDDQSVKLWGPQDMELAEIVHEPKEIKKFDVSNPVRNRLQNGNDEIDESEEDLGSDDDDNEESDEWDQPE